MKNSVQHILDKVNDYKKKLYTNQLIKGLLISFGLVLGAFLVINFIEYYGRLNSSLRMLMLIAFIGLTVYTFIQYILKPTFHLFNINQPLSDEAAATQIGEFFPNIKDKLLNTIQLSSINTSQNSLLEASINQKTEELKLVKFADAINLKENKKYLKYALLPLAIILFISAIAPKFFSSTERIVKFNKTFADPAPFQFQILNQNLKAIKNEDFTLNLELLGNALPEEVFLVSNERKFKMNISEDKSFIHTFPRIQDETEFYFSAGGYTSNSFKIKMLSRPNLLSFSVLNNHLI